MISYRNIIIHFLYRTVILEIKCLNNRLTHRIIFISGIFIHPRIIKSFRTRYLIEWTWLIVIVRLCVIIVWIIVFIRSSSIIYLTGAKASKIIFVLGLLFGFNIKLGKEILNWYITLILVLALGLVFYVCDNFQLLFSCSPFQLSPLLFCFLYFYILIRRIACLFLLWAFGRILKFHFFGLILLGLMR